MYKIMYLIIFTILFSFNCKAQEVLSDDINTVSDKHDTKIESAVDETSEAILKAGEELVEVVNESMPVMVNDLAEMMKEMLKIMAPTMIAVQEGKKLPAASDEMANEIKNSISHKYTSSLTYDINNDMNELKVKGEYEENGTILKYEISRNLAQSILIQDLLDGKIKEGLLGEEAKIENLDGEDIPIAKFENFDIEGNSFVGYDDQEKQTIYLLTNIGAYVSMRIQTRGENYKKIGSDFIYSFDYDAVKLAVNDDGRSIEDIKNLIDKELSDPAKLQELMSQPEIKN